MRQKVKESGKKGISINMLVFILGILVCASLLTYIIPAGQFDVNPGKRGTQYGSTGGTVKNINHRRK